jgi:hypothetical protein
MRTTLNIDDGILKELRKVQKQQGKPLGRIVSDLLALALRAQRVDQKSRPLRWISKPMGARVDLSDGGALHDAMDESGSDG